MRPDVSPGFTPPFASLVVLAVATLGVASSCQEQGAGPAPEAATSEAAAPGAPAPSETNTRAARAAAAGLTLAQADSLVALGYPVYVPAMPEGWMLTGFLARAYVRGDERFPEYTLTYAERSGACVVVEGASEGLGDVFVQPPPREQAVPLARVSAFGPALLGWAEAGDGVAGWENGRVSTEWIGSDGLYVLVRSDDGPACTPARAEEVEAFVASLRPLEPADDALVLGPLAPAAFEAPAPGEDPVALALAAFGSAEPGEGRQRTGTQTLRQTDHYAAVLVTTTDRADDSVRDLRTRAFFVRAPGGWTLRAAGQQWRCQSGRGAQDWTTDPCL
ncbi:MAG: hypothetical protein ACK41D_06435 [Rubricoccaceae bacterium]